VITGRHNRTIKDMRRLLRSKGDRALLEGPHLIAEAVAAGLSLHEILAVPGYFDQEAGSVELRQLLASLPRAPREVAPELLDDLADADSPRGLVAAVDLPRGGVETLPAEPGSITVYAAGLQDPGNLGALARSAEASGATGLALAPGTVHPNHPRALRGSAGSLLRLPVAVGVTPEALDAHLPEPRWVTLETRGGEDLWAADLSGTLVLALGAEGPGLPEELSRRADVGVTISLNGPVESLNATVAAALVLFEVRRRRETGC
jgi:TrmH family RNA methyltransferase